MWNRHEQEQGGGDVLRPATHLAGADTADTGWRARLRQPPLGHVQDGRAPTIDPKRHRTLPASAARPAPGPASRHGMVSSPADGRVPVLISSMLPAPTGLISGVVPTYVVLAGPGETVGGLVRRGLLEGIQWRQRQGAAWETRVRMRVASWCVTLVSEPAHPDTRSGLHQRARTGEQVKREPAGHAIGRDHPIRDGLRQFGAPAVEDRGAVMWSSSRSGSGPRPSPCGRPQRLTPTAIR